MGILRARGSDGNWHGVSTLWVRDYDGTWKRPKKLYVLVMNPPTSEAEPTPPTYSWKFVDAYAPPTLTPSNVYVDGPRAEDIDPGTPVTVRVTWLPQSANDYQGLYVVADLYTVDGDNWIGSGGGLQQSGYTDITVSYSEHQVYAMAFYYVYGGGDGPHVRSINNTRA